MVFEVEEVAFDVENVEDVVMIELIQCTVVPAV